MFLNKEKIWSHQLLSVFISSGIIPPPPTDVSTVYLILFKCWYSVKISHRENHFFHYLIYMCSNLNFPILGRPAWLAGCIWRLELSVRAWSFNCTTSEPLHLYYFTKHFHPIHERFFANDIVEWRAKLTIGSRNLGTGQVSRKGKICLYQSSISYTTFPSLLPYFFNLPLFNS